MSASKTISKIPEEEITQFAAVFWEIIQAQVEEIQRLKDEIARLKGQKPKPKIKPSNLVENTEKPKKTTRKRATKTEEKSSEE